MAVKSIIDVDVNDESFKRFSATFEKYREALSKLPNQWAKVGTEVDKAHGTFAAIGAAMLAQNQLSIEAAKRSRDVSSATKATASSWKDVSKSTREVAGNIASITGSILKWTGIGGIFAGLVGAGSIFGLERMASGVAAGRRSSQGLGTSYGGQKSFGINYGSLVDPGSYLGAVNQGLHSWAGKAGFYGAGMTPGEMQGDTAQVGANLLEHLKKIADNTNPAGLADVMKATRTDQFVTLEDMMRLKAMTPDEFSKFKSKNREDARGLDLDAETQSAWLSFTQQMRRAGDKLENVFVRSLVKLEVPLEHLSDGFIHLVEALGDSKEVKKWIDQTADGLEGFAKTVATKDFQDNVLKFVHNVGVVVDGLVKLGEGILKVAKWFGIGAEPAPAGAATNDWGANYKGLQGAKPGEIDYDKAVADSRAAATDPAHVRAVGAWAASLKKPTIPNAKARIAGQDPMMFDAIDAKNNLPPGTLWALYGAESSYGTDHNSSAAGARGPFQFKPGTAWENGVVNPYDVMESAEGAGRYLNKLNKQFGSIPKAIGAYNWGPGMMGNYLKAGAPSGRLPDETIGHIAKVMGGIRERERETLSSYVNAASQTPGAQVAENGGFAPGISQADIRSLIGAISKQQGGSTTRVEIYNKTGGSVNVSASQLGG